MEYNAQDTTQRNRQKLVLKADGVDFPSCRHRPDPYALPDRPRLTLHHHRAHRCAALDKDIVFDVIAYKLSVNPDAPWLPDLPRRKQSATINGMAIITLPRRHYTPTKCQRTLPCETTTTSDNTIKALLSVYAAGAGRASSPSSQHSSPGRSTSALSVLQKALNLSLYNVNRAPRAAPVR